MTEPASGTRPSRFAPSAVSLFLTLALVLSSVPPGLWALGTTPTAPFVGDRGANAPIDRVCTLNGLTQVYTDRTAAANDMAPDDVPIGNNEQNAETRYAFFGMESQFTALYLDITKVGTGNGGIVWHYWSKDKGWTELTVNDETDMFKKSYRNFVSFVPPSDWGANVIEGQLCPADFFYVRAFTYAKYDKAPAAKQIWATVPNLKVQVQTELEEPVTGLERTSFAVKNRNTTSLAFNHVYGHLDSGSGTHRIALSVVQADKTFDVRVRHDGYVESPPLRTDPLSTRLIDHGATPIVLQYGNKVTAILGDEGQAVEGATVRAGDGLAVPCIAHTDHAHYCPVPLHHATPNLRAEKQGFITVDAVFNLDREADTDPQRTAVVSGMVHSVAVEVKGVTNLDDVTFEKKFGDGVFVSVNPGLKAGSRAYFAVPGTQKDVVIKAVRPGVSGDTGAPFTPDNVTQVVRSVTLAPSNDVPIHDPSPTPSSPTASPPTGAPKGPRGGTVARLPAPADLRVQGAGDGSTSNPQVQLIWKPVPGAKDYVVHAGMYAPLAMDSSTLQDTTTDTTYTMQETQSGTHTYAVLPRDAAGNPGLPAMTTVSVDLGTAEPLILVPAQSGPAIPVRWDVRGQGEDINGVQLWVWEDGVAPRQLLASDQLEGAMAFYGLEGHTYYFQTRLVNTAGQVESGTFEVADADAVTHVFSARVTGGLQAVEAVRGHVEGEPFFAEDGDSDGFPEKFTDPTGQYESPRILELAEGAQVILVMERSTQVPVAVWDPAGNVAQPIVNVPPIEVRREGTPTRPETVAHVDKGGWIYVPVPDYEPARPVLKVVRADGTELPPGYFWRSGGFVALVDDPSTEYRVVYGAAAGDDPAAGSSGGSIPWLMVISVLTLGGLVGLMVWVARPHKRKPKFR